ncbi:arylsulfatase I-like isoform X1 [Homalodisca vitripennis]|uniref:arylsulfatase I-like isoform X1 n=1 Tax=Homalodisca vitripennis TaxID=197043 RepID=UPI001EEC9509|nr:arylsulfatase I-like isoform X1 [Homalodisca vitripennis]XP_046672066.1 arylsulfatase I-like isoform X1 [Homalodisca vitripennis]XP_046672067.1 arylsulfatase I-like isoform X1 [Homalodisca vitripennis]
MADGYLPGIAVASLLLLIVDASAQTPPHIVVILADDLGWNDVGFHGSDQIPTPNIDALAYNGVILNSHYTPALCTPSRSAFMTGKYPIHTGMQHLVILEAEPWGLPLHERLLPQHLKEAGYRTHAVGKWHLGFFKHEYTPTFRGFDSHFGYYQGFQDYYNHLVKATFLPYEGYDMRRNLSTDWASQGRYSTDLFTEEAVSIINNHEPHDPLFLYLSHLAPHAGTTRDPFQAPDEEIAKFSHIEDPERRVYAAMVSKLDQSVGEVVTALRARGMLDNSVIVFMSDNGAPTHGIHSNRGSNYPLRGIKETPWEGGVRAVAAIWSPLIQHRHRVSSQLMYMTDWLPTLYSAAGQNVSNLGEIDGVDMWDALVTGGQSPRTQFVYNIDDVGDVYAAIRRDDWKYLKGNVHKGIADDWYGETGRDVPGMQYDVQAVLRSRAGVSFAGYTTRRQVLQKRLKKTTNATLIVGDQWRLLRADTVRSLRSEAQLKCDPAQPPLECRPRESACLFNIREDPCERRNLADQRPDIIAEMEDLLLRYRQSMVPAINKPTDPLADPALWNNTWISWQDPPKTTVDQVGVRRLVREALIATVIVIVVVLLVAALLRVSSPSALMLRLPSNHKDRKRQLDTPAEQAEKTNLTIDQA